jgi:hypothetical protein
MSRRGSVLLLWLAVLALAGCPASSPAPVPPAERDPQVEPQPRPDDRPPLADASDAGSAGSIGAAGEPCLEAGDCASGVCEGPGCGPDQPGTCAPAQRACTRDLRPYCGCDGQTFRTSGSCPGQRFAFRGECGEVRGAGQPCLSGDQCQSGVCEGPGCGDDQPGTCAPAGRRCTADLVAYCGCDGQTFEGSSSCPGRRYGARRACEPAGSRRL